MPFIAECPYCKKGRLSCPDHVVGLSGTCPNPECGLFFTIVRSELAPAVHSPGPRLRPRRTTVPAAAKEDMSGPRETHSPLAEQRTATAHSTPVETETSGASAGDDKLQSAATAPPLPRQPFAPSEEQFDQPRNRFPVNGFAAASMFLAGFSLCWAMFSHGTFVPLVAAALAIATGIGGLAVALQRERGVLLAAIGPLVGAVAAVLIGLFPVTLDPMRSLYQTPELAESKQRQVIPLKPAANTHGSAEAAAEWVDASKGAAQFDDLWVRLTSVTVEPIELASAPQKRLTTEKWLVVRVQATNNGVRRRIDYESWADTSTSPSRHVPTLRDSGGRTIRQKTFLGDVLPVGQLRNGVLLPGKWIDDVLIFELPGERFDWLRLELPLSAFGQGGKVQWQIPRRMVGFK